MSAQEQAARAEVVKQQNLNGGPIGPFSHYSSISPGSTSGTLSRTQSQTDLPMGVSTPPGLASPAFSVPFHPPSRPTSAAALAPPAGPPPVKRAPFKTHHSRSSSLGFAGYNYDPAAPPPWQSYTQGPPRPQDVEATPMPATEEVRDDQQISSHGSSAYEPSGNSSAYDPESGEPEAGESRPRRPPVRRRGHRKHRPS